jgi:hypothetical protein
MAFPLFLAYKFGKIQYAVIKTYFKNEFIAHRKINLFNFASIESHGSQTHMIDSGSIKNTIIKNTINKGNVHKITGRKSTVIKCAASKLLKIHFLHAIGVVVVFDI